MAEDEDMTAADGGKVQAFRHYDQLVATLEDGDLNSDLSDALHEIVTKLRDYVINHGGAPSADLTLKLKFKLDGSTFEITPKISKSLPDEPRSKAHLWSTDKGLLTPFNPKQMQMFSGPREVGHAAIRSAAQDAD